MRPRVLSFDIFGTVVDWRRGLMSALARLGVEPEGSAFDRIIDAQAEEEVRGYRDYHAITVHSLETAAGLPHAAAEEVARGLGDWPLFPDAAAAMRRLQQHARCVATTNSDRVHREPVERQLGVRLDGWVCAEDLGLYKPDERFWHGTAERIRDSFSRAWWHVSAYADYDLEPARRLGLTTVFVARPHARSGPADYQVRDLLELADLLDQAQD